MTRPFAITRALWRLDDYHFGTIFGQYHPRDCGAFAGADLQDP